MTPRLWEDVLELQKQAKLKDNAFFSAQGAPPKSWGTYFHPKSKNKLCFGLKNAFWPFYCYFGPFFPFSCKMTKNAIFKAKKGQNQKK